MTPFLLAATESTVVIPVGWVLAAFGALGGAIATMAGVMWAFMQARLKHQDTIIEHLQKDIDRLSKGCFADGCLWKDRGRTGGPPQ